MKRISLVLKALVELGPLKLLAFARYRLSLRLKLFRFLTPVNKTKDEETPALHIVFHPPSAEAYRRLYPEVASALIKNAEEVVLGDVRLFGREPTALNLEPVGQLGHWSEYTTEQFNGDDIKFTWEPARFDWATVLGRAYAFTGDERYPETFWDAFERFTAANPPNQGPNWASAQEVGLRLIAWVFTFLLIESSTHSTPERRNALAQAIAQHAARIPPTLAYARAQNNNHLLSEAAALYTAGLALPGHPKAGHWRRLGWGWFHRGLAAQIDRDGVYMQHSANYHRLMLQLALWVNRLAAEHDQPFPQKSRLLLAQAVLWLHSLYDVESGSVPNLGPNDGAYILPLTTSPFGDFTSTLGAAQRAFFPIPNFPEDELAFWLVPGKAAASGEIDNFPLHAHRLNQRHGWATLHGPRFWDRPGHADILHVDLWWHGDNIAQDAGTYLYNADPPWDNALKSSAVHNTLHINHNEPMIAASRFLWLGWPRTWLMDFDGRQIRAETNAYKRFGVRWVRTLGVAENGWAVEDQLTPRLFAERKRIHTVRLHWLLPDWEHTLSGSALNLISPQGKLKVNLSAGPFVPMAISLARAGERLQGQGTVEPTRGWASPTYGHKLPALSLAIEVQSPLPLTLTTQFTLPN